MRMFITTLIIWILCFTVITIGAALTYTWYKDRGPEIKIRFKNTAGLIPNQTRIMYRGAQIGRVNDIDLDLINDDVIVYSRITKNAAKLIGKDSKFWIVQPEFGLDKISNLHAVTTGNYIAVEPIKGQFIRQFIGLEKPPVDAKLTAGLRIWLRVGTLGGIDTDSPILYHGLQIGTITDVGLTRDRRDALITAYIYPEYSDLIRKNSYFANISGFHADVKIFGGSKFAVDSLRTLFKGGISVITPNLNGKRAKNDDVFKILSSDEFLNSKRD